MNPFALSGLLAGITSFSLGLLVLLKIPNKKLGRIWFLFSLSVALWGFGGMWIALAKNPSEALLAWRVAFGFGVIWIPPCFYHFVCIFCDLERRPSIVIHYLIGLTFLLITPTTLFYSGVRWIFDSMFYSVPGKFFPFFMIWWFLIFYSHIDLFRTNKKASPAKKNQIKYFFLATAIGYGGGSLCYLPIFGIDLYPWGNFTIFIYSSVMSYTILRYRLWDLRVLLREFTSYLISSGFIALVCAFIVTLLTNDYRLIAIVFSLCILIPFLQRKMKDWISATRSRSGLIDSERAKEITSLADRIKEAGYNINDLAETVVEITLNELPSSVCSVYVMDHDKGRYSLEAHHGLMGMFMHSMAGDDPLVQYLEEKKKVLVKGEAEQFLSRENYEPISKTFSILQAEVCAPLTLFSLLFHLIKVITHWPWNLAKFLTNHNTNQRSEVFLLLVRELINHNGFFILHPLIMDIIR